jgi:hypothetical protein
MSADTPDHSRDMGLRSMLVPTLAVIGEILVNCYIIWFLLIDYPSRCARLALETTGKQSCGMEPGGYIIASVSAVLILAGVYFLAKWNFPAEE